MNQPQNTPAPPPPEITIEIKVKGNATLATLNTIVEKMAPVITAASALGEATAVAKFGKQKWPIK